MPKVKTITVDTAALEEYFESLVEREVVFVRKELLHLPKPWSSYKQYQNYKFCNVHRCLDKTFKLLTELKIVNPGLQVTLRWTANNVLLQWLIDNYAKDKSFAIDFDKANYYDDTSALFARINKYVQDGNPLTGGAFIVRHENAKVVEYLNAYCGAGNELLRKLRAKDITTSEQATQFLTNTAPFCGEFTANCILSDWFYKEPFLFTDLDTWTCFGPGANRGIGTIRQGTTRKTYLEGLRWLREEWAARGDSLIVDVLKRTGVKDEETLHNLCVQNGYLSFIPYLRKPMLLDVEHWLCEFYKFHRGHSRNLYEGV